MSNVELIDYNYLNEVIETNQEMMEEIRNHSRMKRRLRARNNPDLVDDISYANYYKEITDYE